jgi:hypothetical protein
MHRGERQFMVVVKGVGEPFGELACVVVVHIDQCRDAIALVVERVGRLAAGGDNAVELDHQLVVDGDGHALHGCRPR